MKKVYIILSLLIALAFSKTTCALEIVQTEQSLFNISLISALASEVGKGTDFVFDINGVDVTKVDHFKVRLYCKDGVKIFVKKDSKNVCNKAIKYGTSELIKNDLSFKFVNKSNVPQPFSFKVKSYDSKGKWLSSKRENFIWR